MTRFNICRLFALCTVVSFLAFSSTGSAATAVTACGADVVGDAYLTGDLDCTGVEDIAINLNSSGATLELRGFSIRNSPSYAVQCAGRCSLVGPGSLTNNVSGIRAVRPLRVTGVTIDGAQVGVSGSRVLVRDSNITNCDKGVTGVRNVHLENSTVTGCSESGVEVWHASSYKCSGHVTLENSTVMNNGDPDNQYCQGSYTCADIEACFAPVLDETSACGSSLHVDEAGSWGVCDLD